MTTPSAQERKEWRALAESATGGPWTDGDHAYAVWSAANPSGQWPMVCGRVGSQSDAAFIAAAREGWPRTLDALEAAEAERDAARAVAVRDEAEKGRLWEHLTRRCNKAEAALDEAEERARAVSCELIRQATEGITAERDALRAQVADLTSRLAGGGV